MRDQRSRLCDSGRRGLIGHLERSLADDLRDRARADALGAGENCFVRAIGSGDADVLQIRLELPGCNAGDLRTDAAQVLPLTADRYRVADLRSLAADFTLPGHVAGPS